MPDTSHILLITALGIASATTLMTLRIAKMPGSSAERTVAELRLAQIAALLLVMVASAYLGFAALLENRLGGGLDVVLAVGFLIVAITATLREPREALTILALGFIAHALVDILHRPGALPAVITPRWYLVGCAILNLYTAALCYLPVIKR